MLNEIVVGPAGPIEVLVWGDAGPPVVLLPSLGRGATDFADLGPRLGAAGHRALAPEPRGIGGSTGALDGLTMADLAGDVAAVLEGLDAAPATVVGHAFGNRVARMVATDHPHLVAGVALLACGGLVHPAPDIVEALQKVFDDDTTGDEHAGAVAKAFFAPGNDASVWLDGWHGTVAHFQTQATRNQPIDHWWGAGQADVLVVQPADDVLAVPENSRRVVADLGDRASFATIERAGHALLPEQPDAIADTLLTWLRDRVPAP